VLISEGYRALQQELHRSNADYGSASVHFAPIVAELLNQIRPPEILDYGAGKGRLEGAVRGGLTFEIRVRHYDPAIPEWSDPPQPCAFVACIDVLEHVEPDCIEAVLDDLKRVVAGRGFFTVHTGPAMKVLPDGRNAHLIQQPPGWWLPKLMERFELLHYQKTMAGFWVIVQKTPT
jgi:hypothetical protein